MKQIRTFSNSNHCNLENDVNNFLRNTKAKICEIQYNTSGGGFLGGVTEYSVMIVIEEEEKNNG